MEELSRECLMETLDVFSGLKRIGGSEDEHRACGYLIKKLQEWGIPCRVFLLRPLSGRSDRPLVL